MVNRYLEEELEKERLKEALEKEDRIRLEDRKDLIKWGAALLISVGLVVGCVRSIDKIKEIEREPYKYENPQRKLNIYNTIAGISGAIGSLGCATTYIGGVFVVGSALDNRYDRKLKKKDLAGDKKQ